MAAGPWPALCRWPSHCTRRPPCVPPQPPPSMAREADLCSLTQGSCRETPGGGGPFDLPAAFLRATVGQLQPSMGLTKWTLLWPGPDTTLSFIFSLGLVPAPQVAAATPGPQLCAVSCLDSDSGSSFLCQCV